MRVCHCRGECTQICKAARALGIINHALHHALREVAFTPPSLIDPAAVSADRAAWLEFQQVFPRWEPVTPDALAEAAIQASEVTPVDTPQKRSQSFAQWQAKTAAAIEENMRGER